MRRLLRLTHPVHLVSGVTIWGIWFVAIYAGLSVACSVAPPDPERDMLTGINIGVGLATLFTVLLLLGLTWASVAAGRKAEPRRERFFAYASAGIFLFSAGGTLFVGYPIIFLPPCL
ncbi:hypothetical protein EKK97_05465 [Billgrantia tianxiuensis]|jgi:hypothetical protein|uniref:Uncharacterized protein n=1 Tax=Billgrantia tianxiuensis TaxID=2497861 RepID=A0A6I6SNP3_9GAMM|nr:MULTISPECIES: hypothetical protein [Halomonas]MCE8033466.1 hypothetical protein [Halomonas sp. MCCC 1A11057]QHC49177.1 hypothetical protein EKK97_05465 [Halomonas tianxiuensis]